MSFRHCIVAALVCAAGSTTDTHQSHTVLDALRAEYLEQWRADRGHDYMADITGPQRQAVDTVCKAVVDKEERWMCERRGAHMAVRMQRFASLTSRDADRAADAIINSDDSGVRVAIVAGQIQRWELLNTANDDHERSAAALGKILEGVRGGALPETFTFDLIIVFGDGKKCVGLDDAHAYPVIKVATHADCTLQFALPFLEVFQFGMRQLHAFRGWDDLKGTAFFRGRYSSDARLHLALLSVGEAAFDFALTDMMDRDERCEAYVADDVAAEVPMLPASVRNTSHSVLCGNSHRSVLQPPVSYDRQVRHRYLLAADDAGVVENLAPLLRAPGVPLILHSTAVQEYFYSALVPFVHYVPVTHQRAQLHSNITTSLAWLEADNTTAQSIAAASTGWVNLHKTHAADHRQWKLFYHLLHSVWDSSVVPPPMRTEESGAGDETLSCACDGLDALDLEFSFHRDLWRLTCGGVGLSDELVGEVESSDFIDAFSTRALPPKNCFARNTAARIRTDDNEHDQTELKRIHAAEAAEKARAVDHLSLLQESHQSAGAAVMKVCGKIHDPSEQWMCTKRGARMARQLAPMQGTSCSSIDGFVAATQGSGVRLSVVEGKLRGWQSFGDANETLVSAAVARVLEVQEWGALEAGFTFDFVVMLGDVGCTAPLPLPLVHHRVAETCAAHVALPLNEALHRTPAPEVPRWEELKKRAVFRGKDRGDIPLLLAGMAASGLVGEVLNFGVTTLRNSTACEAFLVGAVEGGVMGRRGRLIDEGAHSLCLAQRYPGDTMRGVVRGPMGLQDIAMYRYVVVHDTNDTNLAAHFALPGVPLLLRDVPHMQEYYLQDMSAWLQYIPLASDVPQLEANLLSTIEWLRDGDGKAAREIAESSTRWMQKHKSRRTDMRQWQLFFHLLHNVWQGGTSTVPATQLSCDSCDTWSALKGLRHDVKSHLWNVTCGHTQRPVCFPWTHDAHSTDSTKNDAKSARLARIDRLREEALQREAALRKTRFLDELEKTLPGKAKVISTVCDPVADAEERWMCERRGAAMAHRMRGYTSLSRAESDAVVDSADHRDDAGMRIFIENGEILNWEMLTGKNGSRGTYLSITVGKVLEGIFGGALPKTFSFDLIVFFGDDNAVQHAYPSFVSGAAPPPYPIIRYSTNTKGPYHIALPFEEAVQVSHLDGAAHEAWSSLKRGCIFRGSYTSNERLHVSLLSALEVHPKLDAGLTSSEGSEDACEEYLRHAVQAGTLPSRARGMADTLCDSNPWSDAGAFRTRVDFEDMLRHRYVLAVDGFGTCVRIPYILRGGGVTLIMPRTAPAMEEYYHSDLQPWVHYVPVSGGFAAMEQNLSDAIDWLESREDAAASIAAASTQWVKLHKTDATDHRQWKLFYHLLHSVWDSAAVPREEVQKVELSCACGGMREVLQGSYLPEQVWHRTCGGGGLKKELAGEVADKEHRAEVFARKIYDFCGDYSGYPGDATTDIRYVDNVVYTEEWEPAQGSGVLVGTLGFTLLAIHVSLKGRQRIAAVALLVVILFWIQLHRVPEDAYPR